MVKKKILSTKREKKSNGKNSVSSDRILRKHITEISADELKKFKNR
ncbi:MAG: hypothetical protein M3N27_03610 [Thermoproteota archaeon]|nr:hypothetical protein [Thermoproteota archaeon]